MPCSESFSESMIRRHELLVSGFRGFGCDDRRRDQDAITESYARMRRQRKIQFFLTIAENLLAERVCREQSVTTRVPIRRKAGILRIIENGDRDRLVTDKPTQIAPASASTPSGVALFSFTRQVS